MNIVMAALILLTIALNTVAQISLKVGIDRIGIFAFHWENILPISLKVITSTWIVGGVLIYAVSVVTWLMVLSRTPVSIAYPISSLGYVTSAIVAYYLLGEDLTIIRIAGIMVILLGVYLVAKS